MDSRYRVWRRLSVRCRSISIARVRHRRVQCDRRPCRSSPRRAPASPRPEPSENPVHTSHAKARGEREPCAQVEHEMKRCRLPCRGERDEKRHQRADDHTATHSSVQPTPPREVAWRECVRTPYGREPESGAWRCEHREVQHAAGELRRPSVPHPDGEQRDTAEANATTDEGGARPDRWHGTLEVRCPLQHQLSIAVVPSAVAATFVGTSLTRTGRLDDGRFVRGERTFLVRAGRHRGGTDRCRRRHPPSVRS